MKKYVESLLLESSSFQSKLKKIAEKCCEEYDGDIVEIGCLNGATTNHLASIAKKYNKKVWAVDPYEIGTQNCQDESTYNEFIKNALTPHPLTVSLLRYSSLDLALIDIIKNKNLCFAYVDGLHTEEACYSDIMTVSHCTGVIAVDDFYKHDGSNRASHIKNVRAGLAQALAKVKNKFDLITSDSLKTKPNKTAYLIRK